MKRRLLIIATLSLPLSASLRAEETSGPVPLSAEDEALSAPMPEQMGDTTKIRSIEDVVHDIQKDAYKRDNTEHFDKVWSRRSYFNLGYGASTLSPKNDYYTGLGGKDAIVGKYKSDYGFSLKYGRSYRLHKKPIYNILQFYVDYTGIDLNFAHYSRDEGRFDSSQHNWAAKSDDDSSDYVPYYIPWNLEKFDVSYGMMVGPSFSVAPFTLMKNAKMLHYLKFNMYFHVGYQASILYMKSKKSADINQHNSPEYAYDRERMNDLLSLNWGHGMLTTFGLSLTWKSIGIGYEHRVAHNRYRPINSGDNEFGGGSYKFKTATNRVFVSFRMGK